ncbi:MAG: two-component regulator propeller domain-containing protein [Chitinophagaceae bacterium]
MRVFYILFLFSTLASNAQNKEQPIGAWQAYLPFGSAIDVTGSATEIYGATPFSLFSVDPATKEIKQFSKISGLSETGITSIKYDLASRKLIVAYSNSNIDVLTQNNIRNIPDLKRSAVVGDKTINHIYPLGDLCYLSTGFGILVLDLLKYEVKDTWFIGNNGAPVKTYMVAKGSDFFYAATAQGLKKTSVTTANPADFKSWEKVSGNNGLANSACQGVISLSGKIIALQNDSLFVQEGNLWKLFYTNGWPIISINTSENKVTICQRLLSGESKVVILNEDGSVSKIVQQPPLISFPKNVFLLQGTYWVADMYGGLSHFTDSGGEQFKLSSPEDIASGEMTSYNNKVYFTAGSINSSWNYQYNRSGFFKYAEGMWTNYNGFHFPQLDSMLDFITVAVDKRDESVWAGSYGGGLLHIKKEDQFQIYKQSSPLRPTIGDATSYRVSGLAFDAKNNLWISNFGADKYLHVLKSNGTWQSFTSPYFLSQNAVAQLVVDDLDQLWIISPLGNGLLVFNHGPSIEDVSDDRWKLYRKGSGTGNLPANDVLCIAKDKSNFIWVGTSDGIGIIECTQNVFNNQCEALLPVVKQGGFTNYLFKGEEVRSIAVDGADRKWIATSSGVWLITPGGEQVLEHFTEENSFLLSNDVKRIAINGSTGEVFFATAKGICSFKSTATEPALDNKNIVVYPNPVAPDYRGTIAIKGLAENSFVKITELNGRLVFQTKALGGQAVWDGKDYTGKRISSGVYLVLVVDEKRAERGVGKIVFIGH